MRIRIGEVLVEHGVLTPSQVEAVLEAQRETGRPFGLLCEELYGIEPETIEAGWSEQYASLSRTVDPSKEVFEERALELVSRRQAWQFRVLPMRFDGAELMIATTVKHLPRALRFATNVIGLPVFFVLTDVESLGIALSRHFPLGGLGTGDLNDDAMADLVAKCKSTKIA